MRTWLSEALGLGPAGDRHEAVRWAGVSPAGPTCSASYWLHSPGQVPSAVHPFLRGETGCRSRLSCCECGRRRPRRLSGAGASNLPQRGAVGRGGQHPRIAPGASQGPEPLAQNLKFRHQHCLGPFGIAVCMGLESCLHWGSREWVALRLSLTPSRPLSTQRAGGQQVPEALALRKANSPCPTRTSRGRKGLHDPWSLSGLTPVSGPHGPCPVPTPHPTSTTVERPSAHPTVAG